VPGRTPHEEKPSNSHHESQWNGELETLADDADFRWGADLFNHGFYWEAHEAWESLWILAPPQSASRHGLQGLIQVAAAMLKATIRDWNAFARLTERAFAKLDAASHLGRGEAIVGALCELVEEVREFEEKRGGGVARPVFRIPGVEPLAGAT